MHALGLDGGRTALVMLAGIGLAGGEQFLATLADERFVLAMRGDDDAEFLREPHGVEEFLVADVERAFVREKDVEAGDAGSGGPPRKAGNEPTTGTRRSRGLRQLESRKAAPG